MKKYERFKTAEEKTIPGIYDSVGRVIRFGYSKVSRTNDEGKEETVYVGYNVPITGHIDYGHIKSQIVRHAYPDKDVDAILNNAVSELILERAGGTANEEHITDFTDLQEWRAMAGNAAKELVDKYK